MPQKLSRKDKPPRKTGRPSQKSAETRERLAAALRKNLKRRKNQTQAKKTEPHNEGPA